MANFLLYMLFSGLEFLATFILIFSMFNIDYKYYKLEIPVAVFIITLISYFMVVTGIYRYVPIPFAIIASIIILLFKFFEIGKKVYSIIVTVGGVLVYGLIQYVSITLAMHYDFATKNQLNDSFSIKVYIMQVVCASVATLIGIYIKRFNSGFGFMLRGGRYKKFFGISILMLLGMSASSIVFLNIENINYTIAICLMFLLFILVFIHLSSLRDNYEFSSDRKGGEIINEKTTQQKIV
ncbi:hypothetical protein BSK59_13420 [Paenibacillus odorifer]|nr:hypothetical protein BSK59_13420 [Paenibacillus odorifer]